MTDDILTPAQIRAARGLLDWSQDHLAERARVGLTTIKDLEAGKRDPIASNIAVIRQTLESAGVKFLPSNGDGPGARLTGHRPQVIRWPSGKNIEELLPFRVAWRDRKIIVFLPRTVLDDLDRTNHRSDANYVASFRRHEGLIITKVTNAIEAGRIEPHDRLRLDHEDFADSF